MPQNGMNVGTDFNVAYYDGNSGSLVDLGDVQEVRITAIKKNIKTSPYNGVPRFAYLNDGYKINFTLTRSGQELEEYFVNLEAANYTGGVSSPGVLNETVTNQDGSTSIFQYTNFVIFMEDQGNIDREKITTQKLEGMASQKIQLQ